MKTYKNIYVKLSEIQYGLSLPPSPVFHNILGPETSVYWKYFHAAAALLLNADIYVTDMSLDMEINREKFFVQKNNHNVQKWRIETDTKATIYLLKS